VGERRTAAWQDLARGVRAHLSTRPRLTPAPAPEGGTTDALLAVRGLSVRFGRLRALDGIDLEVRRGELLALAGENGAGKTTFVGCVAGDVAPDAGEIVLEGRPVPSRPRAAYRRGIAFVRQHAELCDNLDVAANLFLGRESKGLFFDHVALYEESMALLRRLRIPLPDMVGPVGSLSGGTRQLLTVAQAMLEKPRLLILDEPTFSLGVAEAARVEELVSVLHEQGTTILLVSHDVDQMFRLADRIIVLRHGRVLTDVRPEATHRDDVVAMLSGQQVDSSARRQLARLQGLVDQLASAESSSSLSVILSSLGAALKSGSLSIHLREGDKLRCAATLGFPARVPGSFASVPVGATGNPVGVAAAEEVVVVVDDVEHSPRWKALKWLARSVKVESSWSVPVMGGDGLIGVITVLLPAKGAPKRDELDLARLYAGYAASAIERDRLLSDLTARNSVLETIREVLETLTGPVPVGDGLSLALKTLRHGLQADQVVLLTRKGKDQEDDRVFAHGDPVVPGTDHLGPDGTGLTRALPEPIEHVLAFCPGDGKAIDVHVPTSPACCVAVPFSTADGAAVLMAAWRAEAVPEGATALMEDAAHSFQLSLEREEVATAHQETAALRRSQELQQAFLYLLSHELRTPLTAIRGYASSLLQTDVTWDGPSQQRFLGSIAAESARLGRLVEDLLDFSAIESGILRLHNDWCEVPLVLEAAVHCLTPPRRQMVDLDYPGDLPPVFADHDRLEQVVLNLLDNALRHNPVGTRVQVTAHAREAAVAISVSDNGSGVPMDIAASFFDPKRRRRAPTTGAGLGLSITKGIVEAHGGHIELGRLERGTEVVVTVPIEGAQRDGGHGTGIPA
jgi:signal transduction histidine kinase/ABC-type multidrug transport system ATPase subunit